MNVTLLVVLIPSMAPLAPRVVRDCGGRQHPQFSALDGESNFVFLLPERRK